MKNILVLTDFSNAAYDALFYITGLLKRHEANFLILNAFNEHTPLKGKHTGGSSKSLRRQLDEEAVEGLQQIAHRIRLDRDNPKHTIRINAQYNFLPEALKEELKKQKADLIVMGNTGQSARVGVYMGSNVIRVLKSIEGIPIMAIPEGVGADRPNEIVFAADFNHRYPSKVVSPLIQIALLCGAAIRVVHLNEEDALSEEQLSNLEHLKNSLGKVAHSLHWLPDFRQKSGALHSFISERGMGMLAMVQHRHGFLESLIREDVIRKVSFMVEVPILILPEAG